MSLVLVVGRDTHEADPPTDLVVNELRRRGVSVVHLDPDEDREWRVESGMFASARPEQAAVAAELSGTDWAGRLRVSVIRDGETGGFGRSSQQWWSEDASSRGPDCR